MVSLERQIRHLPENEQLIVYARSTPQVWNFVDGRFLFVKAQPETPLLTAIRAARPYPDFSMDVIVIAPGRLNSFLVLARDQDPSFRNIKDIMIPVDHLECWLKGPREAMCQAQINALIRAREYIPSLERVALLFEIPEDADPDFDPQGAMNTVMTYLRRHVQRRTIFLRPSLSIHLIAATAAGENAMFKIHASGPS